MDWNPHRTTTNDAPDIAWTRAGNGHPVVLVHGITENGSSWGAVADRLAEHNDVIVVDLRGHGASDMASDYGLGAMASDLAAVMADAGVERPHLVGHSLGGAVVSAAGAVLDVSSVVNVDQSLDLGGFKETLGAAEAALRDPATFAMVIEAIFEQMSGELLSTSERARISALRQADQAVVLGVWNDILTSSVDEMNAIVDAALLPYQTDPVPYLSLFGIDPGEGYGEWLSSRVPGAQVDYWEAHGHYPHLVDPERFVERVERFWASVR
ncbi:MAG: alpha/beta hydrolase [Acidimicrobiales bacterium]